MAPPVSEQTRFDIEQYIHRGKPTPWICDKTGVHQTTVARMRRNFFEFGTIIAPQYQMGRPRLIEEDKEQELLEFLDERPLLYLFEMVYFLYDKIDLTISEGSVASMLRRCGWTRKKVSLT